VSVFDHGFLYGDGAFEGIRSYNHLVFKLKEHVDRLYETAHTMMIKIPLTKDQMIKAVVSTLKENKLTDAYIRVIVTRGEGDLGLDPKKCYGQPTIIVITDKIALYPAELYKKGLEIITVPTVRNHPEALNPRLKSLNYLNNIMAKIEANNAGCSEAIMLDGQGFVAECTGDNIFIVKNDVLSTPSQGRLRGITLDTVLELTAKHKVLWPKMKIYEGQITRHEIFNADECFLTGTAAELIPIVKVDGRVIGTGKPGTVTAKMLKAFHELTKTDGVKY
jgi:branched-chain amino acid aminotransferase